MFSIILMGVGLLGLIYGFIAAPSSIEEVKEMVANDHHGEVHAPASQNVQEDDAGGLEVVPSEHNQDPQRMGERDHNTAVDGHGDEHYEHILHQLQNKPWSSIYVAAIFFFLIALGTLAFYAVNIASQAGWPVVLFRVMEAITAYLLPGSVIVFLLLVISGLNLNHLFVWMDPDVRATDEIIKNKSAFLNVPFFLIRAIIYIAGWNLFNYLLRRNSLRQDEANDNHWFKQNFKLAAGFLVFFIVTESMMAWDWIMSLDPHWFSTLFGWYVFSSMFVSAITVIALVTIYLKSRGYLEYVNDSHIHDLAKYMFAMSIFWAYLWFSQFMLIWYANIPEEVVYFVSRVENYSLLFFGMLVISFVFPLLILMNTDFKRVNWFVVIAGIFILVGHYIDIFVMIMPGTVGASWSIGVPEIGAVLFFGGLFLFVVFSALAKAPLLPKRNPFIKESTHFHY